MPQSTEDDQQTQQSRPTLRQRLRLLAGAPRALVAWARASWLRVAMVGVACLVLVTGAVGGWFWITSNEEADKSVAFEEVLAALDRGAFVETRDLAEKLQQQKNLPPEELGGPVFALGAAAAYEADDTWSKDRTHRYLVAARYLEEARDRGFPPGRRAQGLYLLGRSLYLSGQIPASRPVLLSALKVNRDERTEIHRLLAGAYLNDANPKLDKALAENGHYLSDTRLSADDRHLGLAERGRILLRLGRVAECLAELDKIPADAKHRSEAIVLRGRLLMHEARTLKEQPQSGVEDQLLAQQKYRTAIKTLRRAQGYDTLGIQATRKAMYLIGVCYLEMGGQYHSAALDQFARTGRLYADKPEGIAASFQEAELSRQLGRDEAALASYRRVLGAVTDPENFSNPWITLDEFRVRILNAHRHYLNTRNCESALQLSKFLYPLFPQVRALELRAQTYDDWGRSLLAQAEQLAPEEAESAQHSGRAQLRRAGRVYVRLAQLQVATREYPERLWKAADAYLLGQDYRNTIGVLEQYLKDDTRRRRPRALVRLGEAMLASDQVDKALEMFRDCIESHPRDAASFRARLLASRAYLEKGDLKRVEDLLRENLNGEHLTPASSEWRDSLFALGELLHVQKKYQEAILRLEEAVKRYPDSARTLQARYLIADSYRQSGKQARAKLDEAPAGTGHAVHTKRIDELLGRALEHYRAIREELSPRWEAGRLDRLERSILRNCYFAVGDVQFELQQYEAAVKAFSTATDRYQNHPEVLEAYVQIANAYRRLSRPVEARATLAQAKVVLGRMKDDVPFKETTNYDRQQWTSRLDWLAGL